MIKINKYHVYVIVILLLHSFIHWNFPYIFGETPVNIMKLDSENGISNYTINLISYTFIAITISGLTTFFIRDKVRWVICAIKGMFISIVFNAVVVLFLLNLMVRS